MHKLISSPVLCTPPSPPLLQTYNLMSERWFTHASPTLFNAGTCRPQLSSCFLVCMKEDSIEVATLTNACSHMSLCLPHLVQGIYDTLKTCANISKSAGGIGIAAHCIRAHGSYIAGVCVCVCVFVARVLHSVCVTPHRPMGCLMD